MFELSEQTIYKEENIIAQILNDFRDYVYPIPLRKRTMIFFEGDPCHQVLFIKTGEIRAFKNNKKGREINLYRVSSNGMCVFSFFSAVFEHPMHANIQVIKDGEALALPGYYLKQYLQQNPTTSLQIFEYCFTKTLEFLDLIPAIAFNVVKKRLAEFLSREFEKNRIIKLCHEQIASEVGTTREVVTRILNELANLGAIHLKRCKIILNDDQIFLEYFK